MKKKWQKIGVLGAGAWGTAIAVRLAEMTDREKTILWSFEKETADIINNSRENKDFLPGVPLPKNIEAISDLAGLGASELIFLVAPTQHCRKLVEELKPYLDPAVPLVICSKGIEIASGLLLSQVLHEIVPNPLAVLSGPSFAVQTAQGKPTALTLACEEEGLRNAIVAQFSQPHFRLYPSADMIGTQLGGALKNTIAIACGVAEGAGLGENARAALIARGLAESAPLIVKMGGDTKTLLGLSGIGDMVLTCTSLNSRNTSLGVALGKGEKLDDIMAKSKSVNEGVWTARSIATLSKKYNIEMPICLAVYDLLESKTSVQQAIEGLLEREIPPIELK